jgi:hypothetical protein
MVYAIRLVGKWRETQHIDFRYAILFLVDMPTIDDRANRGMPLKAGQSMNRQESG